MVWKLTLKMFWGFPTSCINMLFPIESPFILMTAIPSGTVLKIDSVRALVYRTWWLGTYTFKLARHIEVLFTLVPLLVNVDKGYS